MQIQYLCDIYKDDFETYIKQALLFNKDIHIVCPHVDYSKPMDREYVAKKIEKIKKYEGFPNIKITEMTTENHRLVNVEESRKFLDAVMEYHRLFPEEKRCLINCFNAEYYYSLFFDRDEMRKYCGYIRGIMNTVISYIDMYMLFYDIYKYKAGNVLSNCSILPYLLNENISPQIYGYPFLKHPSYTTFLNECETCKKYEKKSQENNLEFISKEQVINILLPNYSELPIDEIYEIKSRANDEIEKLADYLEHIAIDNVNVNDLNLYIKKKINPAIDELNLKIKNLKLSVLQKMLSLRNITFVPLMVALFPELPSYIPLAVSAALISADITIDIVKEYSKLKRDPLYFTLKLNKIIDKNKNK